MIRIRDLPSLTLSGKTCYWLGLLSAGVGFQLARPAPLALGCLFLVALCCSWVGAFGRLRGVRLGVRRPARARAFEPSPLEVAMESPRGGRGFLVRDPARPTLGVSLHVEVLRAGIELTAAGHEVFTRRGRARPGPLSLSCSRPLGLSRAELMVESEQRVLVLPALGELRGPLRRLSASGRRQRHRVAPRRGEGGETLFIRPFVSGDSRRRVHWRSSARLGALMVREFEAEEGGLVLVALGGRHDRSPGQRRLAETAISLTATLLHAFYRQGREQCLLLPGAEPRRIRSGDRKDLTRSEEMLALLDSSPGWPDWSALPTRSHFALGILVHAGTESLPSVPAGLRTLDAGDAVRSGQFIPRGVPAP